MKVITFCEIDESLFNPEFNVESSHSKTGELADVVILDIKNMFQ